MSGPDSGSLPPETAAVTRILLHVEDNPGDVDLVAELLSGELGTEYDIIHASRLRESTTILGTRSVDVILLDLGLPDASGLDTLRAIREAADRTPIVVLTGTDNEELAISCVEAGAQDYLFKSEMRPLPLRRALGYAVKRTRDEEVRELQRALDAYRRLSTETQTTKVTAAMARSGVIKERDPGAFDRLVGEYSAIIARYIEHLAAASGKPRDLMEQLVTALGDLNGGPRDLVDIHIGALDRVVAVSGPDTTVPFTAESRLLALEMMGILVDYYRVGQRRWMSRRA